VRAAEFAVKKQRTGESNGKREGGGKRKGERRKRRRYENVLRKALLEPDWKGPSRMLQGAPLLGSPVSD